MQGLQGATPDMDLRAQSLQQTPEGPEHWSECVRKNLTACLIIMEAESEKSPVIVSEKIEDIRAEIAKILGMMGPPLNRSEREG